MTGWRAELDLRGAGKQSGAIYFGETAVPITVVANGNGPTVVLTAGVHGDEYEGQITLSELARQLSPGDVAGRLIIAPTLNAPACLAGQRLCPIDHLNLNRAFPGDTAGTFTQQLAAFVETILYDEVDYAVDIHGGGAILHFHSATLLVVTEDAAANQRRLDLATAFGARTCMLFGAHTMGVDVGIDGAMLRRNVIGIAGEFGGSAQVGAESLTLVRTGIRHVLARLGVIAGPSATTWPTTPVLVDVRPARCYVTAPRAGVFEPLATLGDTVHRNDVLGLLHQPTRIDTHPTPLLAGTDGIVMAMRTPARTEPGDWMFIIGEPVAEMILE